MGLTYIEYVDILDIKYIARSTIGKTTGMYDNNDLNLMLKSLLPNDVRIDITIDDPDFYQV